MANTFKTKTFAGGSTNASTAMTIYTVPSSTTAIVLGLTLSNVASQNIEVTVNLENGDGDNVSIVTSAEIPAKSSLEIMSGNKIVLQNNGTTGDVIRATCGTASSLDVTLSVLEDV